jgi:hypothetical protein
MIYFFFGDPKLYLIVWCAMMVVGTIWTVLNHYIFLPREVKQIVADIKRKQLKNDGRY